MNEFDSASPASIPKDHFYKKWLFGAKVNSAQGNAKPAIQRCNTARGITRTPLGTLRMSHRSSSPFIDYNQTCKSHIDARRESDSNPLSLKHTKDTAASLMKTTTQTSFHHEVKNKFYNQGQNLEERASQYQLNQMRQTSSQVDLKNLELLKPRAPKKRMSPNKLAQSYFIDKPNSRKYNNEQNILIRYKSQIFEGAETPVNRPRSAQQPPLKKKIVTNLHRQTRVEDTVFAARGSRHSVKNGGKGVTSMTAKKNASQISLGMTTHQKDVKKHLDNEIGLPKRGRPLFNGNPKNESTLRYRSEQLPDLTKKTGRKKMTTKYSIDGKKSLRLDEIGHEQQLYQPNKPRAGSTIEHLGFNRESSGSPVKHLAINSMPKNDKKVRSYSRNNLEGVLKFDKKEALDNEIDELIKYKKMVSYRPPKKKPVGEPGPPEKYDSLQFISSDDLQRKKRLNNELNQSLEMIIEKRKTQRDELVSDMAKSTAVHRGLKPTGQFNQSSYDLLTGHSSQYTKKLYDRVHGKKTKVNAVQLPAWHKKTAYKPPADLKKQFIDFLQISESKKAVLQNSYINEGRKDDGQLNSIVNTLTGDPMKHIYDKKQQTREPRRLKVHRSTSSQQFKSAQEKEKLQHSFIEGKTFQFQAQAEHRAEQSKEQEKWNKREIDKQIELKQQLAKVSQIVHQRKGASKEKYLSKYLKRR